MLALIIPGKQSCTSTNVNVYLQPLIEEFQLLCKGIDAFDAYLGTKFTLKTMRMWNIHDFPTYDLFIGCVTKGHIGCLPCGPNTKACFVRKLKEMVYIKACKYLPCNHPYRQAQTTFKGITETRSTPIRVFVA